MKNKIIKYNDMTLPSNYREVQFNNWREAVRDYKSWKRAARTNEYVADLLYKRNRKNFEKLSRNNRNFHKIFEDLSIGRIVIMFYGLALEGYLKSTLIKHNQIEVFEPNTQDKLNKKLTTHKLLDSFNKIIDRTLTNEESVLLGNLERAINSGKYFFEKTYNHEPYFTSLDNSVKQVKILIKEVKGLLG